MTGVKVFDYQKTVAWRGRREQCPFCYLIFFKGLLGPHLFSGCSPPPNQSSSLGIPPGPACPTFPSGNIPEAFAISCYFPPLFPPPCWAEKPHAASPPPQSPGFPVAISFSYANLKSPTSSFLSNNAHTSWSFPASGSCRHPQNAHL